MKKFTLFLAVNCFVIFLALLVTPWANAQGVDNYWTQPYPISSPNGQAGDQIIFADRFGYVHLFWPETGLIEEQTFLYYSRFDGENWSSPMDILLAPASTRISATFDMEGILHLLFTNRYDGSVYYTSASIQDATSAQGWQKPQQLEFSVQSINFKVDSTGVFHLLYSGYDQNEPGVYYTNSVDNGQTWSTSVWLDPDIPPDLAPSQIQLELGEENSLHAAWFYWDQNFLGRWIRYSHSFDQGQNWSAPFTIDEVKPGSEDLRIPAPSMAVSGEYVHIIWAGDFTTHRKHRVSRDSGRTWNQAEFVFGDLHGQAIGDGLALDALGRPHFFGQIRYPQGVYHSYWGEGRWSSPFMIYLIAQDASESFGERIHAHRVRAAIRAGNQLVVTFASSPSDPQSVLYTMHMTLSDVPALDVHLLPEQTLAPTLYSELGLVSPTPLPDIPTKTPYLDTTPVPGSSRANTPSSGLIWGILPVVFLVASVIIIRFLFRRNG